MLEGLFINACILITVIFISSHIFRNSGLSKASSIKVKIVLGIMGGISACILINFSIDITPEVILDFRDICLILVAIFGGLFPSLIAGMITAAFRLVYLGINEAAFISLIGIMAVSIGCGVLSGIKSDIKIKCKLLLLYSLLIRSIVFCILLEDKKNAILVIFSSWIVMIIVGIGIYYFVQNLVDSHKLLKNLKKESSQDFLTGLSNSRQFDRKYKVVIQEILKSGGKLSLFIIDIDHFKRVNDTYGHVIGDIVLKELGKVLKITCKEHYIVSRIGGEEFAVVLKYLSKKDVLEIAERIRATVESHPFHLPNNKKLKITISIGVAIYPDTVENIYNLRELADKKLYEAKWLGRNKVCI